MDLDVAADLTVEQRVTQVTVPLPFASIYRQPRRRASSLAWADNLTNGLGEVTDLRASGADSVALSGRACQLSTANSLMYVAEYAAHVGAVGGPSSGQDLMSRHGRPMPPRSPTRTTISRPIWCCPARTTPTTSRTRTRQRSLLPVAPVDLGAHCDRHMDHRMARAVRHPGRPNGRRKKERHAPDPGRARLVTCPREPQ